MAGTAVRLRGPDWQTDPVRLRSHYEEIMRDRRSRDIPPWMFAPTPQGRSNLDRILSYCGSEVWRLTFDQEKGLVDPRLKRENQQHLFLGHVPRTDIAGGFGKEDASWHSFFADPEAPYLVFRDGVQPDDIKKSGLDEAQQGTLLASLDYTARVACGQTNWEKFLARHKLMTGVETHYEGEPLSAFLSLFSWAFHNEQVQGHYHYNDFTNFLARHGRERAWHLIDHVLREDYGLIGERGRFNFIDRRLMNPEFRISFVKMRGFAKFAYFLRATGLNSIISWLPEEMRSFEGSLIWRYPSVFSPENPEHMEPWFLRDGGRFASSSQKAQALLHIAEELHIPPEELHCMLTAGHLHSREVSDLLEEGQTIRELVEAAKITLSSKVDRIEFKDDGQSHFRIGGREFLFPQNLNGMLVRRMSSEHMVIYGNCEDETMTASPVKRRVVVSVAGNHRSNRADIVKTRQLRPVYAVHFDDPSTLRGYDPSFYPDISIMKAIGRELGEELKNLGISLSDISIVHQKAMITHFICHDRPEEKKRWVMWYLRDRRIVR